MKDVVDEPEKEQTLPITPPRNPPINFQRSNAQFITDEEIANAEDNYGGSEPMDINHVAHFLSRAVCFVLH